MRVLLGVSNMRPHDGGPPTVAGGLAKALTAAGATVDIAACTLPHEADATREHWRSLSDSGVGLHLFPYTGPPSLYHSRALARFAGERAGDFDVLHTHGVWDLSLLAAGRNWRAKGKPYFVSSHGVLDPWSLAQSAWKKKLALGLLGTRAYLDHAAGLIFGSEEERELARPLGLRSRPLVVPNGVDLTTMKVRTRPENTN